MKEKEMTDKTRCAWKIHNACLCSYEIIDRNQKDSLHSFHDNSSNKPFVGYSAAECKNTLKKHRTEIIHMLHKANNTILSISIFV